LSRLELAGLTKSFGATQALLGVDLAAERGEVHALIGENGAGKSTLLGILSGALRPDAGTMRLDGRPYRPANPQDAGAHGVAVIHQELSLCDHLSVAENVLLGIEPRRAGWLDRRAAHRRTLDVLSSFPHAAIDSDRRAGELPVASRQLVEIARALARDASVLLMDEPTSSLARDDVQGLFACIGRLRSAGATVVYVSHFLEEVREIADRFTVLRDGRSVKTGAIADVADVDLISAMVGRRIEQVYPPRAASAPGETLLSARSLAAPPSVHDATLELRRGEVLGIAGLVGAGRTELVRALTGLAPLRAGELSIRGERVPLDEGAPDRLRRGIGYLAEERKAEGLAMGLSVADNVTMTNFETCARGGWLDLDAQSEQAAAAIRRAAVKGAPRTRVGALSGGNQQKVALARLLHQDAEIALLDEPTRGVDVGSKTQIYDSIDALRAAGKAVLMVSSYLPELLGVCDRLAVMRKGRLSPSRPVAEWTPESILEAAVAPS
jgi:ribose transport system ATP-binding protein